MVRQTITACNTTDFPSPAQENEQEPFDSNRILISHPAMNFTMRYDGKKADWIIERKKFSPEYTTDLNDVPRVGN
ncbi:MAG: DUF4113 domain-containing protein [Treponema sp.]